MKYIIGVDEAGRGALAGPVSVGAVLVPVDFDFSILSAVRDSKQLSPKVRERVFKETKKLVQEGKIRYAVALVGSKTIDKKGITGAVREGIASTLRRLSCKPNNVTVLLDGSLSAPSEYTKQKTIIRGDMTEPAISLASIMAKVTRDRYMERLIQKIPGYGFEIHKGYGTELHRDALAGKGMSVVHRKLFCRNIDFRA